MKRTQALLAIGLVALGFATSANAQRTLGANKLILDNGAGQTITLQTPAAGWTGNIPFLIPIPPAGNPSSGFSYAGTAANQILTWVMPNTTGPAPNNYAGGVQGSWQPTTLATLSIPSGTGTANTITKWTGTATQGNSLLTDNGSLLTYTGATGFNISGTTNMVAATVSSGLNITGGNLLMGGTSVLDQTRNLFNIGSLSLSGAIGTATTVTASGAITGGSLVSTGSASITGPATVAGGLSLSGVASPLSVNGTAGASGSFLTSAGAGATPTWSTMLNPANGGTGVNNGTRTITLGGNLTTSGANALTLTTTGATNVTLPTTGTLATTNDPGMAKAWGVYNPATNSYLYSHNVGAPSVGGGPFYIIPIGTGAGSFTSYTVVVTWYGGVGSNMYAVQGNLAGWSDGTYIYFADYVPPASQVVPGSYVSFVLYAK